MNVDPQGGWIGLMDEWLNPPPEKRGQPASHQSHPWRLRILRHGNGDRSRDT